MFGASIYKYVIAFIVVLVLFCVLQRGCERMRNARWEHWQEWRRDRQERWDKRKEDRFWKRDNSENDQKDKKHDRRRFRDWAIFHRQRFAFDTCLTKNSQF